MATKPRESTPQALLDAAIAIERDLSIMTGAELMAKYSEGPGAKVFAHVVGKPVAEIAPDHNPFWHYCLQTWYRRKEYRKLLHPPRHRDEVAKAVLAMVLGELDKYDGVHHQYPRRGLKSFFAKMAADWVPKRHKIMDDLDVLVLYSHNLERRAHGALESIKNLNRRNAYVRKHFGPGCKTITGKPANFVIPQDEQWGEKGQWDWPCRDTDFMSDQKNMTAEAAQGRKAGAGYNYKFIDDWEADDSRDSEQVREQVKDAYDQLRQLNAPPFTREWSCGTPYHIQSAYKQMLEKFHDTGTPHPNDTWTLRQQERDKCPKNGVMRYFVIHTPALTEDNKPNFPTIPRLSVVQLAQERANEIGRRGTDRFWYLQYMLDPTLTGEQAMQWEWFQPLTPEEFRKRFGNLPKFRSVYCDPAWKGDDNHQEGADAAMGVIDSYSIAGQIDNVLLDMTVSNDMESDEGADEMLRMMRVWHTHFYVCEQTNDKPIVGMMKRVWKSTPIDARPINPPRFIDIKGWSKRVKNDRISTVAGQARMGHWFYLTNINAKALAALRTTVNEYPASIKRDTIDMMANANADEVLSRWVPVAIPEAQPVDEDPIQVQYVTRYTALPAVLH